MIQQSHSWIYIWKQKQKHYAEKIHAPQCSRQPIHSCQDVEVSIMDEWIKKMWCIYTYVCVCVCVCVKWNTTEILLSHTKEWNVATCNNINGCGGYISKTSDRERQLLCVITYMLKKKLSTEYNKDIQKIIKYFKI